VKPLAVLHTPMYGGGSAYAISCQSGQQSVNQGINHQTHQTIRASGHQTQRMQSPASQVIHHQTIRLGLFAFTA
jgi:hypothetical protein